MAVLLWVAGPPGFPPEAVQASTQGGVAATAAAGAQLPGARHQSAGERDLPEGHCAAGPSALGDSQEPQRGSSAGASTSSAPAADREDPGPGEWHHHEPSPALPEPEALRSQCDRHPGDQPRPVALPGRPQGAERAAASPPVQRQPAAVLPLQPSRHPDGSAAPQLAEAAAAGHCPPASRSHSQAWESGVSEHAAAAATAAGSAAQGHRGAAAQLQAAHHGGSQGVRPGAGPPAVGGDDAAGFFSSRISSAS